MDVISLYNAGVDTGNGATGLGLGGGVGVDYDLGDSVGISGDIRYRNEVASTGGASTSTGFTGGPGAFTGFSLGVTKGYSNGLIGVGFEYASTNYGFSFGSPNATAANSRAGCPPRGVVLMNRFDLTSV